MNFYNFKSSGIFINLQCGPQNINNIVLINLFSELIKKPCNTILKKMVCYTKTEYNNLSLVI